MKKRYIKPTLEVYSYSTEQGYNVTLALEKDYVLLQGSADDNTQRTSEEFTEYTDNDGQFTTGVWEF